MKRSQIQVGDIIKVPLGDGLFGYAIIIVKFQDLQKMNIIPETHPFSRLLTIPLIVRTYDILTKDENIRLEELTKIPYRKCEIVSDKGVLRGEYPIILHKDLNEDDIDFPYIYGVKSETCLDFTTHEKILNHLKNHPNENIEAYFSWGFGIIKKENNELKIDLPNFLTKECGPSVSFGLGESEFGKDPLTPYQLKIKNDLPNVSRIQPASATPHCSAKTSDGVRNRKHFIGVLLILPTILFSSFCVVNPQLCFLGKYLRNIPFRFSMLPFSQL
jgi:hypothetical protein